MLDQEPLIDAFTDRGIEGERPWRPTPNAGPFEPGFYLLGDGHPALEVCVVPASQRPRRDEVRELWRARHGRQAAPLLLIAPFAVDGTTDAHICGPTEADLHVREIAFEQAVGLAAGALAEQTGLAAVRYLQEHMPKEGQDFQGLVNQGMFATHTLRMRVRDMPEWPDAVSRGQKLRQHQGRELVRRLGFSIEESNTPVHVLRATNEHARAVAIFLDGNESPDTEGGRFGETSALSQAFTRAERDNIPFVLFTRRAEIRLYAVSSYEGVGRKGQAETYVQANVSLLAQQELGYLALIFSADALLAGGTFERILTWSRDFSADLSARLRDRVYKNVVPALAVAVAEEDAAHDRRAQRSLDDIYEETLVILFRLLFLAYAEDRELLPYATNAEYRRNSLKAIARALADRVNEGKDWEGVETHALWSDVAQLFEAIDKGNDAWGVPAYNGGLFSAEPGVTHAGAAIERLRLTDERFGPPLAALLTERGGDGVFGPIDFRSLSVRDFGTIYEGLLESRLSVATADLTLDARENYIPARGGDDDIVVAEGAIYFHNRSGARKASGSYFTKDFAVEHLLEHALEPALRNHLDLLGDLTSRGDDIGAAEAFFDFRCADIAMGSGHFLVAAVDRIERRMAQFLDEHPIPSIEAELDRLRAAAINQLDDSAAGYEIERRQLLRRQVARRCVYGVDRNQLAVELARLSLWVHTFVPGLPLSFLDHNVVQGDALTGVGTISEAVEYLSRQAAGKRARHGQGSVFETVILTWLDEAQEPLMRLARASDATRTELHEVRRAAAEAMARVAPVKCLFDLISAQRRGEAAPFEAGLDGNAVARHPQLSDAEASARDLQALHFPVAFPEVFLRERPGFDCLIGNPPWDKLQVEEHAFYALHYPGLRGMSQSEAEDAIERMRAQRPDIAADYARETTLVQRVKTTLAKGPFPGLTAGRPDLFKAFAWRFWQLTRPNGLIGIVLPRKALEASGTADWRRTVLADGTFRDVTMLVNRGGWVFDDVHQQYTIGLIVAEPRASEKRIVLRGPFVSLAAYEAGVDRPAGTLSADELLAWSDSATFPLVRDADAMRTFLKMREHPRLDEPAAGWEPRGLRELNATDDKDHFIFERRPGLWPVFKGESFDLWSPDTGTYYAWAHPAHIAKVLQARRANQIANRRSAFFGMPAEWAADPATLPARNPRIAWRDTARATDRRTVRAALVPPNVVLVHQAYYLFWRQGTAADQAYALGVMASTPFDWFARQFVESHVTIEFMRGAPLPRPSPGDPRRARVAQIAARLAAVDARYSAWAEEAGVDVATVDEVERPSLLAELDALVATLYGLDADDLSLIFETFHAGWDRGDELQRTLAYLGGIGAQA